MAQVKGIQERFKEKFKQRKKARSSSGGGSRGGSSGGGGSSVSSSQGSGSQPEKIVVPPGGSYKGQTIRQRLTIARYRSGQSFSGTRGTSVRDKRGLLTILPQSGEVPGIQSRIKKMFQDSKTNTKPTYFSFDGEKMSIDPDLAQQEAADRERIVIPSTEKQTRRDTFTQLTQTPYGDAQRRNISELKKQQMRTRKRKELDDIVIVPDNFFSIEGQKARLQRVGGTFQEIGQNFAKSAKGDLRSLFKGATVSPEFRDTFIGQSGQALTRPTSILGAPAGVALGGRAGLTLLGLGGGFEIAATGARKGAESVQRMRSFSLREREIVRRGQIQPAIQAGFREAEKTLTQKAQFNADVDAIQQQKEAFKQDSTIEAQSLGLTGQERKRFISQSNANFERSVVGIYKKRGYTEKEAKKLAKKALAGEKFDVGPQFSVPGLGSLNVKQLAADITIFATDKQAFEKGAREQLKREGFLGRELESRVDLALKERTVRAGGELAGLLGIEAGAELTGQGLFIRGARALRSGKRIGFGGLFLRGAKATAPAGFLEGFYGEQQQRRSRFQEQNLKSQIAMGGFGAATAGLLGGAVIATRPTKRVTSRALSLVGNIADPFEFFGDRVADVAQKTGKVTRTVRQTPRPKIIAFDAKPRTTFTFVQSQESRQKKPKVSTKTPTRTRVPTFTQQKTPVQTTTTTPVTPTTVPFQTGTPSPSSIFTPAQATSQTPTTTSTPTKITTSIPTLTPLFRAPPPFLIPAPPFPVGGRIGTRKGRKRVALNELEAGRRLLRRMLTGNGMAQTNKKRKKKRK